MRFGNDDAMSRTTLYRKQPAVWPVALLALAAILAFAGGVQAQDSSSGDRIRIGKGRISYRMYCRSCHGNSARGDGPVAEMLKIPPTDLTTISARHGGEFPTEETHRTIDGRDSIKAHGGRDMPIWGNSFRVSEETEDEAVIQEKITQLVDYLRSIQVANGG